MTRIKGLTAASVALAALAAWQPTLAQEACSDIDFADSITARFPNASQACLGVEAREGRLFAHFQAEVVRTSPPNQVRVRFRRPDGEFSPVYDFDMPADARVQIGGRSYSYRQLDRGQELDIYLPSDLWEFHIPETENFAAAQTVTVIRPMQQGGGGGGAVLPRTAGPLPLLGILGVLLTGLGLVLTRIRRHFS